MQAVGSGKYRAPKTILGFLGSLIAIAGAIAIGLAFALAGTSSLHYVIVIFVAFVMVLICAAVGTVIVFASKDPSKLMLGELSGSDYVVIQQQTRGDNTSGEYFELPGLAPLEEPSDEQSAEQPPALDPAKREDDDE